MVAHILILTQNFVSIALNFTIRMICIVKNAQVVANDVLLHRNAIYVLKDLFLIIKHAKDALKIA